jgi:predicted GIY-YIG superfamily endonuclease
MTFTVYLLRCSDNSYYCGQTDSMDNRLQQHQEGKIGYTSTRKPIELVWQGEFEARAGAIEFERQIKGWSRAKKEALIRGDWEGIKELAKSKSNSNPTVRPEPVEGFRSEKASTSSARTVSVSQVIDVENLAAPSPKPSPCSNPPAPTTARRRTSC